MTPSRKAKSLETITVNQADGLFRPKAHHRQSSIPKPPAEAPLFRNDAIDRFFSKIPYPTKHNKLFCDVPFDEDQWHCRSMSCDYRPRGGVSDLKMRPSISAPTENVSIQAESPSTTHSIYSGSSHGTENTVIDCGSEATDLIEELDLPDSEISFDLQDCLDSDWRQDLSRGSSALDFYSSDSWKICRENEFRLSTTPDLRAVYQVGGFRRCPQTPVSESSDDDDSAMSLPSTKTKRQLLKEYSFSKADPNELEAQSSLDPYDWVKSFHATKKKEEESRGNRRGGRWKKWLGAAWGVSSKALLILSGATIATVLMENQDRNLSPDDDVSRNRTPSITDCLLVPCAPMTQSYPVPFLESISDGDD